MLGLFGKKTDHPLADPQSAQQLIDALPKSDALKTVQELTDWLESVRADGNFRLDARFAAVRLLDETARAYERKLTRELYAPIPPSKFQENRLWTLLDDFYAQLSHAYGEVLQGCRDGGKGNAALKPAQPLIAGRAIQAAMGSLKCAATRYAQPVPEVWALLAQCYQHAETEQYLSEPVSLYSGLGACSVGGEFAGVMLWWLSCTGTLKPQQIHLGERLAAHFCRHYTVDTQPGAGTLLAFDLSEPRLPMRLTGETRLHPGLRFVGLGQVQAALSSLIKTLDKGMVPDELNLGGTYEAGAVLEVAERLAAMWSVQPPMRRAPRRHAQVSLQVACGFKCIVDQTEVGLNFGDERIETWEVEDISTNGFSGVLTAAQVEAVKIGMLVGIRPENVAHWGVGIVRRLGRDGGSNLHVGVELLAKQVAGVLLCDSGRAEADDGEPGLWLLRGGADAGEAQLLMKPDTYSVSRTLQMCLPDKNYLLLPLALLEKGEDYDLAHYRKIEQDTADPDPGY